MATIIEEFGLRAVQPAVAVGLSKVETRGVVSSDELVGIEVEIENYTNPHGTLNKIWQVIADGSLRNNGVEFITKPIPASTAPICLQYLLHSYLGSDTCFSPRTSVHVHMNVQDLTMAQVQDIVLLYTVYEKLFYKFTGRGRAKNVYCVPLTDSDLLGGMLERNTDTPRLWSKYTGLNLAPIAEYGTIEFRHMHGTSDVVKLSNWINLICKLKAYVKANPSKHIRGLIAEMNDDFDFARLMHEIFGESADALRYEGPQELGYLRAKQAMSSTSTLRTIMLGVSRTSSFFKFKE